MSTRNTSTAPPINKYLDPFADLDSLRQTPPPKASTANNVSTLTSTPTLQTLADDLDIIQTQVTHLTYTLLSQRTQPVPSADTTEYPPRNDNTALNTQLTALKVQNKLLIAQNTSLALKNARLNVENDSLRASLGHSTHEEAEENAAR